MAGPKTQQNMIAILGVLRTSPGPMGAEHVSAELRYSGTRLSERAGPTFSIDGAPIG